MRIPLLNSKAKPSSPRGVKKSSPPSRIGLFNYAPGSYLETTSHPLYAMFFLLPLIIIYELGTLMLNTQHLAYSVTQKRVVAYVWLESLAELIGLGSSLTWAFPGFLVLLILFCWHITSRQSWKIHSQWLLWMALESFLLTLPLFAFSVLMNRPGLAAATSEITTSYAANIVTSIGAGIYEEMVFRLILMGLALIIVEDLMRVPSTPATIIVVILSAGLFSAHHYITLSQGGLYTLEPFGLRSFLFRAAAGVYFAILFRYRGYGITAGTHAAYNVILFSLS